jgi:hypothetical protein
MIRSGPRLARPAIRKRLAQGARFVRWMGATLVSTFGRKKRSTTKDTKLHEGGELDFLASFGGPFDCAQGGSRGGCVSASRLTPIRRRRAFSAERAWLR